MFADIQLGLVRAYKIQKSLGSLFLAGVWPPPETERVFMLLNPNPDAQVYYTIPLVVQAGPHPISIRYNNSQDAKDNRQTFIDLVANGAVNPVIAHREDGSWTAEMAVPLQAMGITSVLPGAEWHFNAIRFFGINESGVMNSWVPIRTANYLDGDYSGENRAYSLVAYVSNAGRFGSLFFDRLPDAAPTNKR